LDKRPALNGAPDGCYDASSATKGGSMPKKDDLVVMSPFPLRKSTRAWMVKHLADMRLKYGTSKKMCEVLGYKDIRSLIIYCVEQFKLRHK